ncbi:PepSY-associated TM helix domain-containing protein [Pseudomonas sp. S3_E04]
MSKKSRSKLWFLVHSWLALPIWFFVLIVCVTGTLAVVSQEIVWLVNPEMRASKPSDDAQLLSYDQVIAAIKHAQPQTQVQGIVRPDESHFALEVSVTYPDGRPDKVYVNPYSGVIQGSAPTFNFRGIYPSPAWLVAGAVHQWLQLGLVPGVLVGAAVAGLVGDRAGGLQAFLERLFPSDAADPPRRTDFLGDFHRLSGIWSIWFIAVISITGTWFLIEALLSDNQISISSAPVIPVVARESVPLSADGLAPPQLNLDRAIEIAQQRIPGLEASFVSLPGNAYSHLEIGGRGWYPLMFQTATINPYNGDVAASRLLSDRTTLEFVTESMRPLHTGDFGGIWIKLIWFFFGLVLSMMVLSGLLIWTKRTALATANALKRSQKSSRETRIAQALQPLVHRESSEGSL